MSHDLARTTPSHTIELGAIQPTEAETLAWAKQIVSARRRALASGQIQLPKNVAGLPAVATPKLGHYPAGEEDYLIGVKSRASIKRAMERGEGLSGYTGSSTHVAAYWRPSYTADATGYLQYLNDYFDAVGGGREFHAWMQQVPSPTLDEKTRESHTSIVAGTGAGKSELMKALAYHDVRRNKAAVVIIDPHGTMGAQIARWPEVTKSGRLVWLSRQRNDISARFNPLDGRGLSASDKGNVAELLVSTLADLVENAAPTDRMQSMAVYCVRVLLEHENTTLKDLKDFLTPSKWAPWVERGKAHPSEEVRNYFRNSFTNDSKEVSHTGMRDRLDTLLRSDAFTTRFCQPSTFNFLAEIEACKVIIFDLKEMMPVVRRMAGRLVLGMLAGIGLRRIADDISDEVPVHVYVDEARSLVGKDALLAITETRKAGIHLTMAQQAEGVQSPEARTILRTTAVKFASGEAWKSVFLKGDLGAGDMKGDKNTKNGSFWVRWGSEQPPFMLAVRRDLALEELPTEERKRTGKRYKDHPLYISESEWRKVEADQLARYYRPLEGVHGGHENKSSQKNGGKPQTVRFKPTD
jgi:hypothetical protein